MNRTSSAKRPARTKPAQPATAARKFSPKSTRAATETKTTPKTTSPKTPAQPKETIVQEVKSPNTPPPEEEKYEKSTIDLEFPSLIQDDFDNFEFIAEPELSFFESVPLIEGVSSTEEEQVALELIRNTPEYAAAWELELWKQQEKHKFMQHLKQKERHHIQALKSEIVSREDKHRQKLQEHRQQLEEFEKNLKEKLSQMERREQKLIDVDQELKRRRAELESDHARKLEDMKHVIKLAKEDCLHKIEMERGRAEELDKLNKQQSSRIENLEEQYRRSLEEYHEFRKQVSSSDQTLLQTQLNKLSLENSDIEKKLHEATRAKQNYKNLWKRTEAQIEQLKRVYEEKITQLRDERHAEAIIQAPVQQLPYAQPYYPQPMQQPMPQIVPTNEIGQVRQMIKDLIDQTQRQPEQTKLPTKKKKKPQTPQNEQILEKHSSPPSPIQSTPEVVKHTHTHKWNDLTSPYNLEDRKKEVLRLIERKRKLLQTGTYTENDDLIQELNARISEFR
jgi:centrosomal protein CEP120